MMVKTHIIGFFTNSVYGLFGFKMPLDEHKLYKVNYTDMAVFVLEQLIPVWSSVRAPRVAAEVGAQVILRSQ